MRFVVLTAGMMLAGAATAARAEAPGEVWRVVEGQRGSVTGIWNVVREGDRLSGSAQMVLANGMRLTYRVAGDVKDGQLVVHRIGSSDRADCHYVGAPVQGLGTSGTTICDGKSSVWQVVVVPKAAE